MWQTLAGIIVIVCAAALISVVVGLIIGIARKRWKALKYSSIVFGVSLALLVSASMLGSACGDSAATPRLPLQPLHLRANKRSLR